MINSKFGKGKFINSKGTPNDKVLTPPNIAKQIIDMFELQGKVLDAFMGNGICVNVLMAIFKNLIGEQSGNRC